jgi:N-acetylmuramoyl-L-alanine amidase
VVALADAVAVASTKDGGPSIARLAADLRARSWRAFRAEADAREALELYAAASHAAGGTEEGCDADRARALLAGELAADARTSYRELYLASRRQAAVGLVADRSRCVEALALALASASAYRPAADAMRALEREGDAAARRTAPVDPAALPVASALASTSAPPSGSSPVATSSPHELVVTPSEGRVPKGPVKIVSIEPYGGKDAARVVIHLSGPATFQVGALGADDGAGRDPRIFVDIASASARGVPTETGSQGVLRRVRVGAQPAGTRVVLDLAEVALRRRVFYLPDPFRIVVDVASRRAEPAAALGATGARSVRRVVLDPGHGGHDDGAVGPTGLREKDVTLDIAHRAATLLAHELRVEALLTRDTDAFVALEARTARANASHADLFVSIHCNASEDGLARGVQTFVLDHDRASSYAWLAARENSARPRAAASAAIDAEVAAIASSLDVGDLGARSRHAAELLQRATLASLAERYPDTRDQGVRTAGFYVLAGADMPAVLFETSFISNPDDEARLATADYRQKMADAVVNAIRAYAEGK